MIDHCFHLTLKRMALLLLLLAGFFFYDAAALAETNTPSIVIDGPFILPPEVQAKTDEDSAYFGEITTPKGSGSIDSIVGVFYTASPFNNRGTYVSGTNLYIQAPYPGTAGTYYIHRIYVKATTAGTYYLNIPSDPANYNPGFSLLSNETNHVAMTAGQTGYWTLYWISYPQTTNTGGSFNVELKEDIAYLLDPVLQTKTYYANSDASLPTSAISALPMLAADTVITIPWSGADANSGLWKYDVQYKMDDGSWTDWKIGTTATSAVFTGRSAHIYYFQCRAYDRVGNVELYPGGNGDGFTATPYKVTFLSTVTTTAGGTVTANLNVIVDGISRATPYTCMWLQSSNHTVNAVTQSGGTGKQYVFLDWRKNGTIFSGTASTTANVYAGETNPTYTCDFATQWQLTMVKGTGCATTTPTAGTSWQTDGVGVPINATASTGYSWGSWTGSGTGSYTGTTQSRTIYLGGPVTQTANFVDIVAPTVRVDSPNGGEYWGGSTTNNITWSQSDNVAIARDSIYYTINNGSTWTFIYGGTGYTDPTESYSWTLPSFASTSSLCKIRIVARDASGNRTVDESDATFTIQPDGVEGQPDQVALPKDFSFNSIYPNPSNGFAQIKYQLPTQERVTIKVYDLTGRIVRTFALDNKTAGYHTYSLPLSGLPVGNYYCRITAGGFSGTKQIIIVK